MLIYCKSIGSMLGFLLLILYFSNISNVSKVHDCIIFTDDDIMMIYDIYI